MKKNSIQKMLKKYPVIGQFIRFGLIGGLNTGVDLVILITLMTISGLKAGLAYTIFKAISFCAAATFSYFMNKRWAFKDTSKKKEVKKFSQFFIVSLVGAVINVTVATLVVTYLKPALGGTLIIALNDTMWGTVGALGGTAFGLIWNFLGYKLLVFKK
jgi:putative flippase GtrA